MKFSHMISYSISFKSGLKGFSVKCDPKIEGCQKASTGCSCWIFKINNSKLIRVCLRHKETRCKAAKHAHQCDVCWFVFENQKLLKYHARVNCKPEKVYQCTLCDKTFGMSDDSEYRVPSAEDSEYRVKIDDSGSKVQIGQDFKDVL